MRLFLSSAVLLTIVSSVFGEPCPDLVKGKKKFVFYYEKVNWFQALLNCSSQGMSLATIESQEEQDFIRAEIEASCPWSPEGGCQSCWLGGADLHKEGEFIWFSTNQNMTYRNFMKGEPNNKPTWLEGAENCVQMITWRNQWHDTLCRMLSHFVCEYFE